MDFKLVLKAFILLIASGTWTISAYAQWQWVDQAGRKVFSDRAPPAEIKDKDIFKRPSSVTPNSASPPQVEAELLGASAPIALTSTPRLSGKDAELESRKKKAENEEILKKKLEEEKISKAKSDICDRAKINLTTLKSGIRMSSTNTNGEREYFDDTRLIAETSRAQDVIAENCK